jgi:hypothetical protein
VLAAYAALWEPQIEGVVAVEPPSSHMDADAPQFLNVLRVCDIPEILGMIAPRELILDGADPGLQLRVERVFHAANAAEALTVRSGVSSR